MSQSSPLVSHHTARHLWPVQHETASTDPPELLLFPSWLLARVAEPSDYKKGKKWVFFGWTPRSWKWFFILAHTTEIIALLGILRIKGFEAGPVLLPLRPRAKRAEEPLSCAHCPVQPGWAMPLGKGRRAGRPCQEGTGTEQSPAPLPGHFAAPKLGQQ